MWLHNANVYDVEKARFSPADVEVRDGRIAAIGQAPAGAEIVDMAGAHLLPGFIDCHVHICAKSDAPNPNNVWQGVLPGEIVLYAARGARRMLMCGITTARDVGGWDYHEIAVREAIAAGWIEGPRLVCSGRILSITSSTTPYYPGMYEEADGVEAVKSAARLQLSKGADFIKLLATGALTSTKYEKAEAIQYRREEIAAAVAIAEDNMTYVAAHAHAKEGIVNAVECGCRSIEHGSFGDETAYRLMAERGAWLVPTVCVMPALFRDDGFAAMTPEHIRARYRDLHVIRMENMKLARRLGVPVAMGTDCGTPGNHCGDNMQEPVLMVEEAGFTPAEAIRAATLGAATMMRLDREIGSIAVGKAADLIATAASPLDDIRALERVDFVMKGGRVHKRDGMAVTFDA